jgi:hypothetical protein
MVSNFQKQHEVRSLNRNDKGVCGSKSHAKKTQDLSDSSSVQSIASEYYARITIWSGSGDWADMFNGQKGRCIHHQIRRLVTCVRNPLKFRPSSTMADKFDEATQV